MKKIILIIILFYSLGCYAQQHTETAKQEIRKVVATYFNSVDHKDSVTFCNLVALDSVSFFGVNAPETYQAYFKKNPKAQLMFKDNYKSFIHFVVSSNKKAEEKYDNLDIINIWNDNTAATISFNYRFRIDNIETNWGIETWQLIYNGKEWKIISALFSINDPQVTPDTVSKS